jgi:pyruvate dehydrogenase E2 component (dihydrolipoamide acetyltransferase)
MLCEVDTGKAIFDLEAPAEGVVLDIFFRENEEAPLLTPLAVIGEEGEDYERFRPQVEGEGSGVRRVPKTEECELQSGDTETKKPEIRKSEGGTSGEKRPVSPRARRFALRNGIPLNRIQGSGPGGAVVERDVRAWIRNLHV